MSDGTIPERVRRLIHEKSMEGAAGHEREGSAVIFYVQDKGLYLIGGDGCVACLQDGGGVIGGQMQHEVKGCGRVLALDQVKADGPYFFPGGKFVGPDRGIFPFLRRIEIPVFPAVDGESIVGT